MGSPGSRGFEEMPDVEDSRILMVGLDGAGKTTMLYRMKQDEVVSTVPTIGFNVETVQFRNMNFTVWDVGSQSSKIRPLWRRYFEQAHGLIFVLDSTDRERIETARQELAEILGEKSMQNTAVLVLANKQDLPQAMSNDEVAAKLGLQYSKCAVKPVCAVDGSGLSDALDWLTTEMATVRGPRMRRGGKGFGKQSFL